MIWQLYVFVAFIAFLLTAVSFSERLAVDAQVGASSMAFILWSIWAFSGYDVTIITNTGVRIHERYEALVIIGLVAAAMMLIYTAYNIMQMFGLDPERLWGVRL